MHRQRMKEWLRNLLFHQLGPLCLKGNIMGGYHNIIVEEAHAQSWAQVRNCFALHCIGLTPGNLLCGKRGSICNCSRNLLNSI